MYLFDCYYRIDTFRLNLIFFLVQNINIKGQVFEYSKFFFIMKLASFTLNKIRLEFMLLIIIFLEYNNIFTIIKQDQIGNDLGTPPQSYCFF